MKVIDLDYADFYTHVYLMQQSFPVSMLVAGPKIMSYGETFVSVR